MGYFDEQFRQTAEPKIGLGDAGLMMLPIIGPFAAAANVGRKRKKAQRELDAQSEKITDFVDEDPISQRVAARMMARTGEQTMPGMLAAHNMSRQYADPSNMGNPGSAAMKAASAVGKYYPAEGTAMARYAHKELQAPWKPEEGQMKPVNFTKNGKVKSTFDPEEMKALVADGWQYTGVAEQGKAGSLIKGSELGMTGPDAEDSYLIERNEDGSIRSLQSANQKSRTNVSVGGTDLSPIANILGDGGRRAAAEEYKTKLLSYGEGAQVYDDLIGLVERNTGGGVSGFSGAVNRLVDSGVNAAEFIATKTATNEQGQSEAEVLGKYNSALIKLTNKIFPEQLRADATMANSMTIQLAYQLARMNNMGTAGGGRGITDADMRYALQQLGSGAAQKNFLGILKHQRQRLIDRYEDDKVSMQDSFPGETDAVYPGLTKRVEDRIYSRNKKRAPKEDEDEVRTNPALLPDFIEHYGYDPTK